MNPTDIAAYALAAFAASVILSCFYWGAVRPVLLLRFRYKIYELRDRLRRSAIEGSTSAKSFSYQYVEDFMNKAVVIFPTVSILTLFRYGPAMAGDHNKLSKMFERFERDANASVRELRREVRMVAAKIVLLNSPWFSSLLGLAWVLIPSLRNGSARQNETEMRTRLSKSEVCETTEAYAAELPRMHPQHCDLVTA